MTKYLGEDRKMRTTALDHLLEEVVLSAYDRADHFGLLGRVVFKTVAVAAFAVIIVGVGLLRFLGKDAQRVQPIEVATEEEFYSVA